MIPRVGIHPLWTAVAAAAVLGALFGCTEPEYLFFYNETSQPAEVTMTGARTDQQARDGQCRFVGMKWRMHHGAPQRGSGRSDEWLTLSDVTLDVRTCTVRLLVPADHSVIVDEYGACSDFTQSKAYRANPSLRPSLSSLAVKGSAGTMLATGWQTAKLMARETSNRCVLRYGAHAR